MSSELKAALKTIRTLEQEITACQLRIDNDEIRMKRVRDETLERAAVMCESRYRGGLSIAKAIRAMKEAK